MSPRDREIRARWWRWAPFAAAAAAALAFLVLNTLWYVEGIERFNARASRADASPLPGSSTREAPRGLFLDTDSYLWNHFGLEVASGRSWRVRRTDVDNYPFGREVHWSSAYTWLIAAAGRLRSAFTPESLPVAVERASRVLNPLLHLVFVLSAALLAARRLHPFAGAALLVALTSSFSILQSFFPGYPDHHGLVSLAIFGTLFPLYLGGGGIVPEGGEAAARRWFVASAAWGAFGLWVSAVTFALVLLSVGTAAVAAMLVAGRGEGASARFAPGLWRTWGITGAAVGFGFYLLEYFPNHLGLRLEVNHPLYHLGWIGGACLVSYAGAALLERRSMAGRDWGGIAAALAAVALLPLAIWLGGADVYNHRDPFLWRLSRQVMEFQRYPLGEFLRSFGVSLALWVLAALLLGLRGLGRERRFPAALALLFCLVPLGMSLWQRRWGSILACGLSLAPVVALALSSDGLRKTVARRLVAGVVLLGLAAHFTAFASAHLKDARLLRDGRADHLLLSTFAAAWDAARHLRGIEGDRRIVLASTPWPTTVMSYAGGFHGVGSLAWENLEGQKAMVDLFSAETDDEALRIVRERGITHIAVVASDFSAANQAFLKYGRPDERRIAGSLGRRMFQRPPPWWLAPVGYVPRSPVFRSNPAFFGVYLFRVDPRVLA